ncbi:hypothetical protein [Streptomyces sp. NPDC018352]
MLLRQLLDTALEGGVLSGEVLDGLSWDHPVGIAKLAHELANPLPLD